MRRTPCLFLTVVAALCTLSTDAPATEDEGKTQREGTRLFFRMVGAQNNAPILPKTRSVWTRDRQVRVGWEPDAGREAEVKLPPGLIATGFGAAVAPEWDVKRLRVWARPLLPGGLLGEEREFRGGADLVSGVEKQVRLEPGRVLTSAGLNCMLNDINGILATSAVLKPTATASSR